MDGDRDLQLLLLALRDRAVDMSRLADAAGAWGRRAGSGLMAFLVGRGVLSADDLHRLESATAGESANWYSPWASDNLSPT